jgi:putative transposase
VSAYRLIEAQKAAYSVPMLCRLLGVSRSYGAPRVHAELAATGIRCSRKRVARLMRRAMLRGCLRGRRNRTTRRVTLQQPAAPDLVGRNLASEKPDRLW